MIITISREYGSGGRLIGRAVAEALEIPFFDKAIIRMISEESGLTADYVARHEESRSRRWFDHVAFSKERLPVADVLYIAEQTVIERLAREHDDLVIVGRAAGYRLRDVKDHLRVFVYASPEDRKERLLQYYELGDESAEVRMERVDRERKEYYREVTHRPWGHPEDYDLMLNSRIGIGNAVRLIVSAVRHYGEEVEMLGEGARGIFPHRPEPSPNDDGPDGPHDAQVTNQVKDQVADQVTDKVTDKVKDDDCEG